MKKPWFLAVMIFLLVPWLLVGCGISQELYDAVLAERDSLVANMQSIQSELETAKSELNSVQSELESIQSEFQSNKDELEIVKGDLDTKTSELDTAESQLNSTEVELKSVEDELAEIKKKYPPKDFSSRTELEDWLLANDVSDKPITADVEGWFARALEVQEDAFADGYVVSVDYDGPNEQGGYTVFCTTIINGNIWYWDPETDDITQDYSLPRLK